MSDQTPKQNLSHYDITNLVGACKTAEQAMSYWERMGVNIDCPPWTALTTVRDVLLDIEKKQSIINL
jgi:hypothetical protein